MELIKENFELVTIILFTVVILILTRVYIYNVFYAKYFTNKKFQIRSTYEIDPKNQRNNFVIYVYNKNINDVSINSLGFLYRNQSIDYFKKIKEELIPKEDIKLVIPSRDAIKVLVPVDQFESIIYDNNRGKKTISKIMTYVTDTLGVQTKFLSKSVRSIVVRDFKIKLKETKMEQKQFNENRKFEMKKKSMEQKSEKKTKKQLEREVKNIKKESDKKTISFIESLDAWIKKVTKRP
jgi:hypothetical protein